MLAPSPDGWRPLLRGILDLPLLKICHAFPIFLKRKVNNSVILELCVLAYFSSFFSSSALFSHSKQSYFGHSYSLGIVISYITKMTRSEPCHPLLLPMPDTGTYFHESNIFISEILEEFFLLVILWAIKPRNAIIFNGIIHYSGCSDWTATCALRSMTNVATEITVIDGVFQWFIAGASLMKTTVVDPGEGGGGLQACSQLGQISFISMQFWAKNWQIISSTNPHVFLSLKSWIRHWNTTTIFHRSTSITF